MTIIAALLALLASASVAGVAIMIFSMFALRALWRYFTKPKAGAPVQAVATRELLLETVELAQAQGGKITAEQAAEKLGITRREAQENLARLVRGNHCRVAFSDLGASTYVFRNSVVLDAAALARDSEAAAPTRIQPAPQSAGTVVTGLLADRYRVVKSLKKGGMGAVYEAVDTKLADSPCAVKEILADMAHGEHGAYVQQRFYEEMKALVELDHPSIPKVRDYIKLGETIYIVMDLVRGTSLEDENAERHAAHTVYDPLKAADDVLALLDVLEYLHTQSPPVVHRDVKLANILREAKSGRIKLVDFGLARHIGVEEGAGPQTMVGTVGFCAPEQLMGKAELRSDVFSAGVTLYTLLVGKAPENMFFVEPLQLEGFDPKLSAIVTRATQPKAADRYPSAAAMATDLREWRTHPTTEVAVHEEPYTVLNPLADADWCAMMTAPTPTARRQELA